MGLFSDLFLMSIASSKAIICAIPSSIVVCGANFVTSTILLPYDVYLTYRCLLKTKKYGINIKLLAFLLLPFALFAWPFLVAIYSLVFGFYFGIKIYSYTLDEKKDSNSQYVYQQESVYGVWVKVFIVGYEKVIKDVVKEIVQFWKFNTNSFYCYIFDMENYNGRTIDINLIQTILSFFIACHGVAVMVVFNALVNLFMILPGIVQGYRLLFPEFWKELDSIFMVPVILLVIVLIPIGGPLGYLGLIFHGIFMGIRSGIIAYQKSYRDGLLQVYDDIRSTNDEINDMLEIKGRFMIYLVGQILLIIILYNQVLQS